MCSLIIAAFFLETYRTDSYAIGGIGYRFVQDNRSQSVKHTIRGLHAPKASAG
jgi:dTDP-4-dehydrorhamnose 3,5-epimerase-like enzyme